MEDEDHAILYNNQQQPHESCSCSNNELMEMDHPEELDHLEEHQATNTTITNTPSPEHNGLEDHHDHDDDDNVQLLRSHQLFGWTPDPNLSDDENYMDLVMILTRSSICLQGCMACVLVQSKHTTNNGSNQHQRQLEGFDDDPKHQPVSSSRLMSAIIATATNQPLYSELGSDVHAEVGALGQAARHGRATEGCTAYITMPPCAHCFASLVVSGITRIVTRRATAHPSIVAVALQRNVTLVDLSSTEATRQGRIQQLVAKALALPTSSSNDQSVADQLQQQMILDQRKRKKLEKQKRKQKTIMP
jgi:deoxycytidylate deaminase